MIGCSDRRPAVRPLAFTLLELMLVLALLAVICAAVYPALRGPLDNQRLRQAGDQVRTAWTQARVEAMTTGLAHVFRYQLGTGEYRVEPFAGYQVDEAAVPQEDLFGLGTTGPASGVSQDNSLPRDCVFRVARTQGDTRMTNPASPPSSGIGGGLAPLGGQGAVPSGSSEGPMIWFYPNGTTSTASLALANDNGRFVLLALRGLTGTVSVSGLLTENELPEVFGP